jgi:ectoine hydroxylase-related dioxygenase (phytanoyl-CoA dioxygenase family)
MTDEQKYFFDLNGYLVLEGALSTEEVAACNEAIDQNPDRMRIREGELLLSGNSAALKADQGRGDLLGMLSWPRPWCQLFRDLLIHPSVIPVLNELLREGWRLDHLYGIVMTRGTEGHVLHGGGDSDDPTGFYRFQNGRLRCGLTVVSWQLSDVPEGAGGFCCIPGSHKANLPTPSEVARLERDLGVVRQVTAEAGDAIVFTEALTHGTLPWKADHDRRSILYKYSPGPMSYSSRHLPPGVEEILEELTPAQRAVLEPPYLPGRPKLTELL